MIRYLPFNPDSTVRVSETVHISGGKAFLRHIPKKGSVVIDGFLETDSVMPQANQFSCLYATDSMYRDANRVLNFNKTHNGQDISVSYVAIGTVITADDMNEIKAHIEDTDLHGGTPFIAGDGIAYDAVNEIISARLGQGLHFDEQGRIAIFLGNGVVYSAVAHGLRANDNGTFSILVDNLTVGFDANNAITINVDKGLDITERGITIKKSNGLAFDADGGLFVHCGKGIAYDELNRICVRHGRGLTFDGYDLIPALGNGLTFDSSGNIEVSAQIASSIPLGAGLYLDDEGHLTTNPPVTQWAYHDSGYDVIPAAPLIYVNDTQFYQPEMNATRNDMFNTPEGVMEAWIRCDLWHGDTDNMCGFGIPGTCVQCGGIRNRIYGGVNYGSYPKCEGYDVAMTVNHDNLFRTGLLLSTNANNHFLMHIVSHPTDGYVEVTCNYGTYRYTGKVNGGNPLDKFFVYSSSTNNLFSNFEVSNTPLEY